MKPASLRGRYWNLLADPMLRGPLPHQGLSLWQRYWLLLTAAGPVSTGSAVSFRVSASADGGAASLLDPVGLPLYAASAPESDVGSDILVWPDRRGLVQRLIPLIAVAAVVMLLGIAIGTKSVPTPRGVPTAPQPTPYAILPDPGSGGVADIAFNPSGTIFATADLNGRAYLWNAATDQLTATLAFPDSRGVAALAFSPDGTLLAVGDRNGTTRLVRLLNHRVLATLRCGSNAAVSALAFSPDGKFLLTGTTAAQGAVCMWSTSSLTAAGTPIGNDGRVTAIAFGPSDTTVAVSDATGAINLWGLIPPRHTATLTTRARVTSVAFSPDGKTLAAGETGATARLWDLATRTFTTLTARPRTGSITSVAFSPSGTVLAAASQNGSAYLWNSGTHHLIAGFPDQASDGINAVAFNPKLAAFATADQNGLIYLWSYTVVSPTQHNTAPPGHGQPGQRLGDGILALQGNGTGYDLDAVNTGWDPLTQHAWVGQNIEYEPAGNNGKPIILISGSPLTDVVMTGTGPWDYQDCADAPYGSSISVTGPNAVTGASLRVGEGICIETENNDTGKKDGDHIALIIITVITAREVTAQVIVWY